MVSVAFKYVTQAPPTTFAFSSMHLILLLQHMNCSSISEILPSYPGNKEADRQAETQRAGLQHPRRAHQGTATTTTSFRLTPSEISDDTKLCSFSRNDIYESLVFLF